MSGSTGALSPEAPSADAETRRSGARDERERARTREGTRAGTLAKGATTVADMCAVRARVRCVG
jgi:hypothetical protein